MKSTAALNLLTKPVDVQLKVVTQFTKYLVAITCRYMDEHRINYSIGHIRLCIDGQSRLLTDEGEYYMAQGRIRKHIDDSVKVKKELRELVAVEHERYYSPL